MLEIVQWQTISDRFQHGLLLGNGASIAVDPGFGYDSLFEAAKDLGHITEPVASIFDKFGVNDFELVLRRLWQAKLVNEALGLAPGPVEKAYLEVRTALISAVRATHVSHEDAMPYLTPIYHFMQGFKTIISLNYDLIIYWAAMYGNGQQECARFKDCFFKNDGKLLFQEDWQRFRDPIPPAIDTALFFYPHGNLVLTRTPEEYEQKIAVGSAANLLESILERWEGDNVVPLFVCEGTATHKKQAIESASYLQRVYREVIPELGESLVIYGWSLSAQDQHILDQLKRADIQRVAVSVRANNQAYAQRAEEKLRALGINEIVFFDAESPTCWNNPLVAEVVEPK